MTDPRTAARIRRQQLNSGGFERDIDWQRLDHSRHHPDIEVVFAPSTLVAGRERRQRHIYEANRQWCDKTVVDVGCDRGRLGQLVTGRYLGLDRFGMPDVRVDLLSGAPLPLRDASADFVVCTDVLEHLADPHFYCDELFRIARGHVLIGLPNCWTALWPSLTIGRPAYKNYGLPPEAPGDRHRWLFSTDEAIDFVLYRASRLGFRCRRMTHFTMRTSPLGLRWIDHGLVGRAAGKALDLTTNTLQSVLDRRGSRTWLNRRVASTWWLLAREPNASTETN